MICIQTINDIISTSFPIDFVLLIISSFPTLSLPPSLPLPLPLPPSFPPFLSFPLPISPFLSPSQSDPLIPPSYSATILL